MAGLERKLNELDALLAKPGRRLALASSKLGPTAEAQRSIMTVRGKYVTLDSDLAAFYGVSAARLSQQANRNAARFPADFRFQLTTPEADNLMLQKCNIKLRRAAHALPPARSGPPRARGSHARAVRAGS
jgi:hypothetical protein